MMHNDELKSRISELSKDLENKDPQSLGLALEELSVLLPELDVEAAMHDRAFRRVLVPLPDRLWRVFAASLSTPSLAKIAAFALVAAFYPDNYKAPCVDREKKALRDLREMFEANNVAHFFHCAAKLADVQAGTVALKIDVWHEMSFELDGQRLPLRLFTAEDALDINVRYNDLQKNSYGNDPEALKIERSPKADLIAGQLASLKAVFNIPLITEHTLVVVDLVRANDDRKILDQEFIKPAALSNLSL